jgi:transcriptional regulator GlxA family with amidase domain
MNVGIYIFENAEELDWAGPYEVLAAWARGTKRDVFTVGDTSEPIRCAHGLRVLADHTWETAPPIDLLVVPGGNTSVVAQDDAVIRRVREIAARDGLIASVCTGAFILHAAGLLDGVPATTHWSAVDRLRDLGVDVREERFVDGGQIVTAAGVSAGIDMALHLVARLDSDEEARAVRRYIQYDPQPPV